MAILRMLTYTKEVNFMSEKIGYESPILGVIYFEMADAVAASGDKGGIELPDHEW